MLVSVRMRLLAEYSPEVAMITEKDRADGRASRPVVTSYDSEYEHGLEHMIDVQCLVEDAAAEEMEVRAEPLAHSIPGVAA